MKIHEYQAKQILAKYGVPVPQGSAAISVDEADLAVVSSTSFEQGRDWKEAAVADSQSNILLPGRNLGLHRAAVERYWRLKGE